MGEIAILGITTIVCIVDHFWCRKQMREIRYAFMKQSKDKFVFGRKNNDRDRDISRIS